MVICCVNGAVKKQRFSLIYREIIRGSRRHLQNPLGPEGLDRVFIQAVIPRHGHVFRLPVGFRRPYEQVGFFPG